MNTSISISTLRQLWSIIEYTHANILLTLNERELAVQLVEQVSQRQPLTREETAAAVSYIRSKALLIRDLAQTRSSSFG